MEQNNFQRESSIPNNEQIDWPAITYLQGQLSKCQCDFRIEAYDKSIDKVLDIPKRKATDTKLAEEIFKDAKRELSRRNDKSTRLGKSIQDYHYLQDQKVSSVEYELDKQKEHLSNIIKDGLNSLLENERFALYIKATKAFHLIEGLLQVSQRQYRNILKKAQQKLQTYPNFKQAFFLAFLHTDFEEYDSFLQTYLSNNYSLIVSKAI